MENSTGNLILKKLKHTEVTEDYCGTHRLIAVKALVDLYKENGYFGRLGPGLLVNWMQHEGLILHAARGPDGLKKADAGEPYMQLSGPYHAVLRLSIDPDKPYHAFVKEACKEVFENSLASPIEELSQCTTRRALQMRLKLVDQVFLYRTKAAQERFGIVIGEEIGKPERTAMLLLTPGDLRKGQLIRAALHALKKKEAVKTASLSLSASSGSSTGWTPY